MRIDLTGQIERITYTNPENGYTIAQVKVTNIVKQWATKYPANVVLRSVLVSGSKVDIVISGTKKPTTIKDLGVQIQSEVKQVVNVDLRFLPSKCYKFP